MATAKTPSSPLPQQSRRRRTVLTPSQKEALLTAFQQNPYPGISTRTRLEQEIGVSESRIQVWFQNQRSRRRKQSKSVHAGKQGQTHQQEKPPAGARERVPKEARRQRTAISASQCALLVQAFEKNRFPGLGEREDLAAQTGLPECRVQIWFQNRRARHPGQTTKGPLRALAAGPAPRPPLPPSVVRSPQSSSLSSAHFSAATSALGDIQPFAMAAESIRSSDVLPPGTSSVGSVAQVPWHSATQDSQAAQEGERSNTPWTLVSHLPTGWALGQVLSPPSSPLWSPCQSKCQENTRHAGAVAFFQDGSVQCYGQRSPVDTATAETPEGALPQPAHIDTVSEEIPMLLDEILSTPELQDQVGTFLSEGPQEDDPPGLSELPLSQEEFQALLDML